jgi:3-oxoacyl-[acyl-carrier protein] reductase
MTPDKSNARARAKENARNAKGNAKANAGVLPLRQGVGYLSLSVDLMKRAIFLNLILDKIIQNVIGRWPESMTRRIFMATGMQARTFTGKVALVTGGSKGIGAGIVRRLAFDGALVAFTYSSSEEKARRLVREIESAGGEALALKADSASAEELRGAVAKTRETFGTPDIFVSNAGILTMGTIDSYSLEDFDRMVAINVRAAFIGIQAAAREMKDGGRIVVIGSNTAIRTAFPGGSIYSMTKAALTGLVRGAAIDLAPRAITVNNVQPGPTATDMTSAHMERVKPFIPLKRMGDVSEVAGLVSYLASEEAGFITGASLTIDGGYVA